MSIILIVDDLEQNRYLLHVMLAAVGEEVLEAANGVEALELARRAKPDLIISDILMPQMDGFALCRECKQDEQLRDIPLIFYTATYTDPRDEALALQLGAARFLVKPIDNEDFINIVHEVLQAPTAGQIAVSPPPLEEDTVYYRLYNEALIRKLEDKMLDMERLNHSLAESEERFRRLAENAPDVIYRYEFTPQRRFAYVSPAATNVTGYAPQEYYSDPDLVYKLVHTDDRPLIEMVARGEITPGQPLSMRGVRKDGRIIWIEQRNVPVFNEAGELIAIEGITRDVTERQRAEERIETQLHRLGALHTIDTAITSYFDLRLVLGVVLEQTTNQLGMDAACVLLLNSHSQTLTYAAGRGLRTRIAETARIRVGEGFAGRAALERCAVHTNVPTQAQESPYFATLWAGEGFAFYYGMPLLAKGQVKGVLEVFHRAHFEANDEWRDFLETLAGQAAIAVDNARLFEELQHTNMNLSLAYDATIEGWSRALDLRDKETEGHTQRVTEMTERLARMMGINEDEIIHIRRGALLHDIGKMGVPDSILLKPAKLTDEEWVLMRQHPQLAFEMLASIDYLRPALNIPGCHHEKWDGSGYPRGLKGEQIPLAARIFAVVDVWDALTSDRPYRKAWSQKKALDYIREQAGKHFDPKAAELFLRMVNERAEGHQGAG